MSHRGPRNQPLIERDTAKNRHSTLLDGHETNSSKHINQKDFASLFMCCSNVKMLTFSNAKVQM